MAKDPFFAEGCRDVAKELHKLLATIGGRLTGQEIMELKELFKRMEDMARADGAMQAGKSLLVRPDDPNHPESHRLHVEP